MLSYKQIVLNHSQKIVTHSKDKHNTVYIDNCAKLKYIKT